jgi:hypothetical protein
MIRVDDAADAYQPCLLELHVGDVAVHEAESICEPAVPEGTTARYAVVAVVIAVHDVALGVMSLSALKKAPATSTPDPLAIKDNDVDV